MSDNEELHEGLWEAAADTPGPRNHENRPRILLADDNTQTRDYLSRLLTTRYDVDSVVDGAAALAAVRLRPPDLVLTDATMPGLDGLELVRQLRLNPETAQIPVLFLSARAGAECRREALNAGADDYLEKPFSATQLLTCVRNLLRNIRALDQPDLEDQGTELH